MVLPYSLDDRPSRIGPQRSATWLEPIQAHLRPYRTFCCVLSMHQAILKRNLFCHKILFVPKPQPRVGEQRSGGRAARVRSDVLRCAAELLNEVGYDKMSIEEVAARAGVHKTTVYRRWLTKPELVADAVYAHSSEAVQIADTGSLPGDLRHFTRQVAANIGSEGGALRSRSIVAAAATSDELTNNMHSFWVERLAYAAVMIERAIERDEVSPTTDANLIIEALIGPLWVRLLLTGEPINDGFADQIAELVAAGAMSSNK